MLSINNSRVEMGGAKVRDFLKTKSSLFLEWGEGQTHRDCFSQTDSLFLKDWLVQA